MIKYGETSYFRLLDLRDKLNYRGYNKLDLLFLDKLRLEIEMKIKEIDLAETNRTNILKTSHENK